MVFVKRFYSRLAKLIQDEEPKTRGKNLFKFEESEKLGFEQKKLEKKILKQEESKKSYEVKTKLLNSKIQKTKDRILQTKNAIQNEHMIKEAQLNLTSTF